MGCECGRKKKQTSGAERAAVQLRKLVLPKALTQCKIVWWVIGDIDILCKINWRVYRFEGQNNLIFACNLMWRSTPGRRNHDLRYAGNDSWNFEQVWDSWKRKPQRLAALLCDDKETESLVCLTLSVRGRHQKAGARLEVSTCHSFKKLEFRLWTEWYCPIWKAGVFRQIDRKTPALIVFDLFVLGQPRLIHLWIKLNAKQLADINI